MRRLFSKALGLLLSVVMMVSLVPGMAVLAATDEEGTGSEEVGEVTISEEAQKFPAQWEGEAETMHRQRLTAVLDRAKKAGDELKKRPDRLLVITGVYEQTEQQNIGSAQTLDSNVIS